VLMLVLSVQRIMKAENIDIRTKPLISVDTLCFLLRFVIKRMKYPQVNFSKGYLIHYYFLLHNARSAKPGIAIVSRPFVCPSVCNVEVSW